MAEGLLGGVGGGECGQGDFVGPEMVAFCHAVHLEGVVEGADVQQLVRALEDDGCGAVVEHIGEQEDDIQFASPGVMVRLGKSFPGWRDRFRAGGNHGLV